ncbi:hypothetical protein JCM14076_06620 [Methylosoma difficile]
MHRTSAPGHVDNHFVSENIETGQSPTQITPDWMNSVQEEICGVIQAADIALDAENDGQLALAISLLINQKIAVVVNVNEPLGTKKFVGSLSGLASCWEVCDGRDYLDDEGLTQTTPDLRDRFLMGGPGIIAETIGEFYGSNNAVVPSHSHGIPSRAPDTVDYGIQHDGTSEDDRGVLNDLLGESGNTGVDGEGKNIPASYAQIIVMKARLYVP